MYKSETSKVRHLVEKYIVGRTIDIGFGGDAITPEAETCDLPTPYAHTGSRKVDIPCNVSEGIPVEDSVYDTVYSSHLIEDFVDTQSILKEFIRILKNGGTLILVFPDQKKFEEHCHATGQPLNSHHKIKEMGLKYMIEEIRKVTDDDAIMFESDCEIDYNVVIVAKVFKDNESNKETKDKKGKE